MLVIGIGCSCRKRVAEHVSLEIENIACMTCSVCLEYPFPTFRIPAEGISYLNHILRNQILHAEAVKGAPFFIFNTICKNDKKYAISFYVIDGGYVLVQCSEKKFIGKIPVFVFRELIEFLGKLDHSITDSILSAPVVHSKPYSDIIISCDLQ